MKLIVATVIVGLSRLVLWRCHVEFVSGGKHEISDGDGPAGCGAAGRARRSSKTRRAAIEGLKTVGIVNEWTRRHFDLNLIAPSFHAIDPKSKTVVCELVYAYLMIMPKEYKLSD